MVDSTSGGFYFGSQYANVPSYDPFMSIWSSSVSSPNQEYSAAVSNCFTPFTSNDNISPSFLGNSSNGHAENYSTDSIISPNGFTPLFDDLALFQEEKQRLLEEAARAGFGPSSYCGPTESRDFPGIFDSTTNTDSQLQFSPSQGGFSVQQFLPELSLPVFGNENFNEKQNDEFAQACNQSNSMYSETPLSNPYNYGGTRMPLPPWNNSANQVDRNVINHTSFGLDNAIDQTINNQNCATPPIGFDMMYSNEDCSTGNGDREQVSNRQKNGGQHLRDEVRFHRNKTSTYGGNYSNGGNHSHYDGRSKRNGGDPFRKPTNYNYPQREADPTSDFPIGVFHANEVSPNCQNGNNSTTKNTFESAQKVFDGNMQNHNYNERNSRESGIVDKLLHSYGFIRCPENQARLFFHFSSFDGNVQHLKNGDTVEFEVTYDRKTCKPVATSVVKMASGLIKEDGERLIGLVTSELNRESSGRLRGRISYDSNGECFFFPYGQEDVEGQIPLGVGDTVSFQIERRDRSGSYVARYVSLEGSAKSKPVRYKGIVKFLNRHDFGLLEIIDDNSKQLIFHLSDATPQDLVVGDYVEFNIITLNDKEIASEVSKLSAPQFPLKNSGMGDVGIILDEEAKIANMRKRSISK